MWQLQELSLQAAERVVSAQERDGGAEALRVLTHLAQNFPLLARSLVRTTVRPQLKEDARRHQKQLLHDLNLQPHETALYVNGQHVNADLVDVFGLLDVVRDELRLVQGHSSGWNIHH